MKCGPLMSDALSHSDVATASYQATHKYTSDLSFMIRKHQILAETTKKNRCSGNPVFELRLIGRSLAQDFFLEVSAWT